MGPVDPGSTGPSYRPGSAEDFDRLYRDSYGKLLATMHTVLGDRASAEDCVQEAFVRALRAWPRWSPDAPAEAWLHRIAMNVAISQRRRQAIREVGELVRRLGRPPEPADPGETVVRQDLLAALRRLPPRQSAALVLRHYHGYTNREIGQALGVPERTIASRLIAARTRLRQEMGTGWGSGVISPDNALEEEPNHE